MMRLRLAFLLTAPLALALSAAGQDPIREVLHGEKATVVFSPNGGYSPRNYLKRFRSVENGQLRWATQNGVLSELIRRAPKGSKIRIGAFRLDEREVMDSLFAAAKRGCEVKLWLKGPPGLTYMVAGHEAIAQRANDYLRERRAQNKEAEWGDFQVQIGTAEQMSAYGKINDMHQKFGVIAASETHGPGLNHGFLGTSNIGASSDTSHNEHRVFFTENPGAVQRLWSEFGRLWTHLGKCRTRVGGDPNGPSNETPESTDVKIKLPGGGFAQEDPALQLRFTYEKVNGKFHKISDDYVREIGTAGTLAAGETVWIAQFGFGVPRISDAILRAAKQSPQVQFRIMVHMAEGDTWSTRQLATAGLPNLKVAVKWDSHKLKLAPGQRPGVPGPNDPGPALLHHKAMVMGSRLFVTGAYNFFSDADDQGENIVLARADQDPLLAPLVADARAEFQAMWDSPALIDASLLFGPEGLFEQVTELSEQDGFLALKDALDGSLRDAEALEAKAGISEDLETVKRWLDALTRFRFATEENGRWRRPGDPDKLAHGGKDNTRKAAEQRPWERQITATVAQGEGGLELVEGDERWALQPSSLGAELQDKVGQEVTLLGSFEPGKVTPLALIAGDAPPPPPARESYEGVVVQGGELALRVGSETLRVVGPAAKVLTQAGPDPVKVFATRSGDQLEVVGVEARVLADEPLEYAWVKVGAVTRGETVEVTKLSADGKKALVHKAPIRGYATAANLAIGRKPAISGMTDTLPPDGQ